VGYITPSIDIETISLSPYFANGILKGFVEVLYVLMLLDRSFTLLKELYTRIRLNKDTSSGIMTSLKEHYWDCGTTNWLTLSNVLFGSLLCFEWLSLVFHLNIIESTLAKMRRPSGEETYDDNDSDVWSLYHHEIADVEETVILATDNMVVKDDME